MAGLFRIIFVATLFLPLLLVVWQQSPLPQWDAAALAGVQTQLEQPVADWQNVLKGRYQKMAEAYYQRSKPGVNAIIRSRNQLYAWCNLNHFFAPGLKIVRCGDDLMFTGGLTRLCDRDYVLSRNAAVEKSLQAINQVSSEFKALGIPFALVIVSGKEAVLARNLPWYYRGFVNPQLKAFDYQAVLGGKTDFFRVEPHFPRSGTHWNTLSADAAIRQVFAIWNQQAGSKLELPAVSSRVEKLIPDGQERDLADLLNQWVAFGRDELYPELVYEPVKAVDKRVFIWADSFGYEWYKTLQASKVFAEHQVRLGNIYSPLQRSDWSFFNNDNGLVVMVVTESNLEHPELINRLQVSMSKKDCLTLQVSLEAAERESRKNCQFNGLSEFTPTGAWTTSRQMQMRLDLPEAVAGKLELSIDAHPMLTGKCRRQRLIAELDSIKVGECEFTAPGKKHFILPAALVDGRKTLNVVFKLPDAVIPAGFEDSPGSARLGLYIRNIEVKY